MLKNLRCQRNDFHINGTQLTSNRAENTAAAKLSSVIEQHTGVIVKTDIRTVCTTNFLLCANYQSLRYCTLLQIT